MKFINTIFILSLCFWFQGTQSIATTEQKEIINTGVTIINNQPTIAIRLVYYMQGSFFFERLQPYQELYLPSKALHKEIKVFIRDDQNLYQHSLSKPILQESKKYELIFSPENKNIQCVELIS